MFIKKLHFKNFKIFEDKVFEFKKQNIIKGHNGSGKTAFKEAILFVLYNKTPTGSTNTDSYIMKDKEYCEVELTTDKHVYYRKRSKTHSIYKIDGKDCLQKNNRVPFEIFSSVFNVGYFMSLNKKIQQELLLKQTPKINRAQLFIDLGGKPSAWLEKTEEFNNLADDIKYVGSKKLAKNKEKETYNAQITYLKNFPFDELAVSKPILKKVKKVIENEIQRLILQHNVCKFEVSEFQNTYKILSQLLTEEMKLKRIMLLSKLHKKFKNVEIILSELYKNEMGYKSTFKFLINDIEYVELSSGEKLQFNLVISKFFNSLIDTPIDCYFLDDSSLLDKTIDIPDQSFCVEIWPFALNVIN